MKPSSENLAEIEPLSEKDKKEKELMSQVFFLLEHLTQREEVTIKLILDCLYDIGSINLIDQKFRSHFINKVMKPIAKMSKPLFKIVAMRWVKKNCPELIANWLHSQVTFNQKEEKIIEEVARKKLGIEETPPQSQIQKSNQEVDLLRSQVKLLTVILIGMIGVFGGGFIWLGYSFQQEQPQLSQPGQSEVGNKQR
ncbi:MAG: hypothetical protein WA865_07560 [Spirulinaceae cyanobacterium]